MASVYRSCVIAAPAAQVWQIIRDFNGLAAWTSFVEDSRIEMGERADQVGCIRNFRLKGGGQIREKLLALSDFDLSCTYSILESPMDLSNYVATLSLTPVTDADATFAQWQAEFDCEPEREDALLRQIGEDVFHTALKALQQRFSR
jgi:hypothetical protein|tara:strand:- start:1670 stop:2107 length:438 start_codon:yes stop_codon:yes gene_type:complete